MIHKEEGKQIKAGAVISYGAIFISILSALIYTPWMKNQIGDSNYGLYTLVTSLIAIFLMDFGLGTSVTRFVSKYRAENNNAGIGEVLGLVFKLYIIIDIIIAVVLIIVYFLIGNIYIGLTEEEIMILKKVYIVFGTYSIIAFPFAPLSGILNAYEKFIQLKLCDLFQKLFAILLIVIALTLNYGIISLVVMNAISGIATIVLKIIIIKKNKLVAYNFSSRNRKILIDLMNFSIWVTLLTIAQRLIFNIAPSILGITSNSIEIARLAPASQLEGYFFTFAFAINGLFFPTVARYDVNSDMKKYHMLLKRVGKYQIIFLGLLFVGIATCAPDFVGLWMGDEYKISGYCTILMIFPSLLMYPQQIANTLIAVRNEVKYQAIAYIIIGLLNVILSFVLTPYLGAIGSSVSIFCAYMVNFVLLNIIYKKRLGLNLKEFYIEIYGRYLPIIILGIIISKISFMCIPMLGWMGLVFKICICTGVYLILLLTLGMDSNDRRKGILAISKRLRLR